jgi:hypothetical protein
LAIQTAQCTATRSLKLKKGRRSRAGEERIVSRCALNAVAEACGVAERAALDLCEEESLGKSDVIAPPPWQDLLLGRADKVQHPERSGSADVSAKAILPGAFNPMHVGHRRMLRIAEDLLGVSVDLEISVWNVDKPPLDYHELRRRTSQFASEQVVWLTRAAKFEEKAKLFPGATFLVGTDTLRRIVDPRYYAGDAAACRSALERIAAAGCRFLVFGRNAGDRFVSLADLKIPEPLNSLCQEVPAEAFREDVSSTEIRRSGRW